jgi:hypothetical protein
MSEIFWLKEPSMLFNNKFILNIIPNNNLTYDAKLNALTRFILVLTILGYFFTHSTKILIISLVAIIGIIILYKNNTKKINKEKLSNVLKEGFNSEKLYNVFKPTFTNPTKQNPLMNVLLPEIQDNPQRKMAAPSFSPYVEKDINNSVKQNLNPKLFRDLGDNIEFDTSMRSFYTNPNTLVPNDQKAFAEFCYGNMKSCKDGDDVACINKNYRYTNP